MRPTTKSSAISGNSVIAVPSETTTYYARHIDADGCAAVDSVLITVTIIDTTVVASGTLLTAVQQNASYLWFNCDSTQAITGETAAVFNATINGSYAVALEQNECLDTSACVLITNVGVIENGSGTTYRIAPNPTSGSLTVYAPSVADYRIELYNATGSLVHSERFVTDRPTLLIDDLPAGIYWMRINGEGRVRVVKM